MDSTDRPALPHASASSAERGIRVLVVDDHEVLADSLAHVVDAEPDLETVGVADTLETAQALLSATEDDVILLDHSLPDGNGVSVLPTLHSIRPGVRVVVLTAREREVLGLLSVGVTNTAIATRLGLSVHTVRNHIANLCTKLGAHSKLEALSIAVRQGILSRS